MASLNRFMRGSNSFGTRSVDKLLGAQNSSIQFQANAKYKQEDIDTILRLRDAEPTPYQSGGGRSFLDRSFDTLLMPNYIVAGAVDGMVRGDKGVLEGMWQGVKAGNPFGKGFEEGETTFSNVIESAGWEDDKFWGSNVLRGTLGFGLDVLLDPTTYMTFGLSAVVKGTGKVGKSAQVLEELATKSPEFAQGLREAGSMTDEMAENIVLRSNGLKSADELAPTPADIDIPGSPYKISQVQFAQEVDELKRTYNKVLGIDRKGVGVTLGVQNMPFGGWVANKLNITKQPITLVKDSTIRAVSDGTGMSSLYASSREAFYGGKLGKLLSTQTGVKKLATESPEELYKYIGAVNKLMGKDLDKLAKEKAIRDVGTTLLKLTPAEQKKMIQALENPSLWQKATDMIRGSGTKAWDKMREDYIAKNDELLGEIAQTQKIKDEYAQAGVQELKRNKDEVEKLKASEDLTKQQSRILENISKDLDDLIARKEQVKGSAKQPKNYASVLKALDEELAGKTKQLEDASIEQFKEVVPSKYAHLEKSDIDTAIEHYMDKIGGTKQLRTEIDASRKTAVDGVDMQDITKQSKNAQLMEEADSNELREFLSEYLFGNTNVMARGMSPGKVESLAHAVMYSDNHDDMIRALSGEFGGHSLFMNPSARDEIRQILSENENGLDALRAIIQRGSIVSDDMKEIYQYLATKYNYGSVKQVRERVKELSNALEIDKKGNIGKQLATPMDFAKVDELDSLTTMLANRQSELDRLLKIADPVARKLEVQKLKDAQTREEMYEVLFGDGEQLAIHSKALNDLSDTTSRLSYAGTKYNRELNVEDMSYAEEASSVGISMAPKSLKRQAELKQLRETKSDVPFTREEIYEHSFDANKTFLLDRMRKVGLKNLTTPEAKKYLSLINAKVTSHNKLKSSLKHLVDTKASKEAIEVMKKSVNESVEEIRLLKEEATVKSNLFSVLDNVKNLTDDNIKFMSAQLQASNYMHSKLYAHHKFDNLTTVQKDFLSGMSYSLLKKWTKEGNAVPNKKTLDEFIKYVEKNGIKKIQADTLRKSTTRAEQIHASTLAEKVTYDSGVEFKTPDGVIRGVVQGIKEVKETKIRKEVDIKHVTDEPGPYQQEKFLVPLKDKDGNVRLNPDGTPMTRTKSRMVEPKPVTRRVEEITETPYDVGTGVYNYEIKGADGVIHSVEAKNIVGTYVDDFQLEKVLIPKYTTDEIARIESEMQAIKNRIRATKGAVTKDAKKVARSEEITNIKVDIVNKQIDELLNRKRLEEGKFLELNKVVGESKRILSEMSGIGILNAKYLEDTEKNLDRLIARQEQIAKSLDNTDDFEMLIKLDLGEDGYAKVLNDSAQSAESADLVIDRIKDWDKHMVDTVKSIRSDFLKAGLDEAIVGKLEIGALSTMVDKYFPRALSDEGKEFFDKNPHLIDKYGAVAREYGFGKEFNSFVRKRADETRHLGLHAFNDMVQKDLGIRIFEENIGKAYVNRMMTSSDMVFDQRAMKDLMYRFGHKTSFTRKKDFIKDGYTRVMNYGMFKDAVRSKVLAEFKEKYKGQQIPKEQFDTITKVMAEDMVRKAGFDVKILDGETTPFMVIDHAQAPRVRGVFGEGLMRDVNTVTIERANRVRQFTMEREDNAMLKMYDKFLTFFKLNQTTIMPAFHVRNHLGAMFVGWLGVGKEAFKISSQKSAYKALKSYGDHLALRDLPKVVSDMPGGKNYYWDEVMDLANTYKVIDEGFMMKDFGAQGLSNGTRIIPGKFDPFNTKEFGLYKIGSKVATYSDNINRMTQFTALLKQGKTPAEASETVRKYMFDYGDLTSFEMRVMKRIFPYYTYMRKNLPLMANELLDNTEKMQLVAKIHRAPQGMLTEEQRIAQDEKIGFAEDWTQMPFQLNGQTGKENILMNLNMPYMQMRDIPGDDNIGDTAKTFASQTSPMLKVPFELATNWNSFFDSELVTEEGNQLSPRVVHVLSQLSAFNAVKQFVTAKTADDRILTALNTATGVKMTTYDLEGAKQKIAEDAYNQEFELTVRSMIGGGVRFADGLKDNTQANISKFAINLAGKPYDAFDENGPLSPVSGKSYESMSTEKRKEYSFDKETQSYINNRALEFEKEQYAESGVLKKFAWMLIKDDGFDKRMVHVDSVTDGDTFKANENGKNYNIRLLLVDTPESAGKAKENPQTGGKEASRYTSDLILGKDVKIYLDGQTTYDRRLAFVEVGGESLQESLLKEGLGKVRQYDQNYTKYAEDLYNIEEDAYEQGKGVWKNPGNAVPRSNSGFVR